MCPSGATCLSASCCFNEKSLKITKRVIKICKSKNRHTLAKRQKNRHTLAKRQKNRHTLAKRQKNRQHNGQKTEEQTHTGQNKKDKRTNDDLQNIHIKLRTGNTDPT
jgi:hypothetical protein